MKRVAFGATLALLVVIALLLGAAAWLVATERGLRTLVSLAGPWLPGELTVTTVNGRLLGPLQVGGVRYQHAGTSVVVQHAELDWVAAGLLTGTVHVRRLAASDIALTVPDATPGDAMTLPDIRLPWRLKLDEVTVTNVSIDRGTRQTVIDRARLVAFTQFEQWHIDALEVDAGGSKIALSGTVRPFGRYAHDLTADWHIALRDVASMSGHGSLRGDLAAMRLMQHVRAPFAGDLDATITDVIDQPRWSATVRAPHVDVATLNASWPDILASVDVALSGTATAFESHGRVSMRHTHSGTLRGEFALSGDRHGVIRVQRAAVTRDGARGSVRLSGDWRPDGRFGRVNAQLQWQDLDWPLAGAPMVTSPHGQLHVSGGIERYAVTAGGMIGPAATAPVSTGAAAAFPPLVFALVADGDDAAVRIPELTLDTLDGRIHAAADVAWAPAVRWRASVRGERLNPAVLDQRWPGELDLAATLDGQLENSAVSARLRLDHVAGMMRQRPLHMSGTIDVDGADVRIHELLLISGQSRATLAGAIGAQLDLALRVQSPELLDLHPDAAGRLHASARLSGRRDSPLLDMTVDGRALRFKNSTIASLTGTASAHVAERTLSSVRVSVDRISAGVVALDTLHVEGSGSPQSGGMHAVAVGALGTLVAHATSTTDAKAAVTTIAVDRADLLLTEGGSWRLDPGAAITVGPQRLDTRSLCWTRRDAGGSACVEVERTPLQWRSDARFDQVPLQIFARYIPQQPVWSGAAAARFSGAYDAQRGFVAHLTVDLGAGELSYPLLEGETGRWRYHDGDLALQLDAEGLRAGLLVRMENDDRIDARVALPGFDPLTLDPARQPIAGIVNATLRRTGLIDLLVPEVQGSDGDLSAAMTLDGTLAATRIAGALRLHNGRFVVPRLGLTVTELTVDGESVGTELFRYRISARSGPGTLQVSGVTRLDATAGWPTELHVTGTEVEISRIAEARVHVSPDLRVRTSGREIHVDGQITVPFARLQPRDISGAVTVSDDAVVVGAEPATHERWQIHTRVRLILGDRVSLYGFGFEGRISGNLLLTDRPGEPTIASGELGVIEGRYRAYGQRLTIERGQLLFTGGPVSNPGLDLRAVRQVDNVTAGIQVRGTLRAPRFELFSNPAMGETDALSYLVLGRPLESGSSEDARLVAEAALLLSLKGGDFLARRIGDRFGLDEMRIEAADSGDQAYFVIGRYLSPRLYISYGVGLIDSVNTVNIRYQLSRRWQLRAESGLHQSTDMVYTIDK